MNKKYLSKEKQKELRDYLNSVLPTKIRVSLLKIKLRTGEYRNYQSLWKYICDDLEKQNNDLTPQYLSELRKGNPIEAGQVVNTYINQKWKTEWETVNKTDIQKIDRWLNYIDGFTKRNHIPKIDIYEVIECQSLDDFVSRFDKKNIDPEQLKRTDEVKKSIDTLYKGIEYNSNEWYNFNNTVNEYLQTKDEQVLNNLLNN